MKRLFICLMIVLVAPVSMGAVDVTEINHDTVTAGDFDQSLRGWIDTLNTDIVNAGGSVLANRGTGNVYYVDSATGADTRVGTSLSTAVATIDAAVNLCTANNGDVIYVVQDHNGVIDNGTSDAIDLDVAGITVVGLGYTGGGYGNRPVLVYDTTTDEMVIDADNVVVYNIDFLAGVSAVTNAIEVKDGADNCAIINCGFPEPLATTFEFVRGIVIVTADNLIISGCEQICADATGATNFIDNDSGVTNGLKVVNCNIYGEYAEGPIHSDDADLENFFFNNTIQNLTTGQHAIEMTANATGWIAGNTLYGDTETAILDPGAMMQAGNNIAVSAGVEALPFWVIDQDLNHFIETAVADTSDPVDMTAEVPDDTILANILDDGGDTSAYDRRVHSLAALGIQLGVAEATGDADIDISEADYTGYINMLTVTAPATGLIACRIDIDFNKATTGWDTVSTAADVLDCVAVVQVDGTNYRSTQIASAQITSNGDGTLDASESGMSFIMGPMQANASVQIHVKMNAERGDSEQPYRVTYVGAAPTITAVAIP
jgi:hypothetical protein